MALLGWRWGDAGRGRTVRLALAATEDDPSPCLVCDRGGTVVARNAAARELGAGDLLPALLRARFAEPARVVGTVLAGLARTGTGSWRSDETHVEARRLDRRHALWRLPPEAPAARADAALEGLPVALVRLGPDGAIRASNEPARTLLADDLPADRRMADLLGGLGRDVGAWVDAALAGSACHQPEILRVRHQEVETHVQVVFAPDPARSGGVVAVLQDATELKTLEAQFVQSQKMQAIGQLAGGVAHDFNNLLTAISGHCDLLLLRREAGDPDHADLTEIGRNASRAAGLVGQLLAFSRKQTQRLEPVDLRDCLNDMTHLLNRLLGEKVRLLVEHDPALAAIRGDRRQLEQVILNLVVNARDAMGDGGGDVRIATRNVSLDAPLTQGRVTLAAGRYVHVEVGDDGPGIPPEMAAKIFEPFFTTKAAGKGTGLGLSTAYGIVKQTGGFIFAETGPDGGASFALWFPACAGAASASQDAGPSPIPTGLPLLDPPTMGTGPATPPIRQLPLPAFRVVPGLTAAGAGQDTGVSGERSVGEPPVMDGPPGTAAAGPEAGPAAGSGIAAEDGALRILLVEDEAPVRAFAARALRLHGHMVSEAASGEEALLALRAAPDEFHLFVSDVVMPGLDGPSWVRRARADGVSAPVIFVSGYAEDALAEAGAAIPGSRFLAKPFSLAALNDAVDVAAGRDAQSGVPSGSRPSAIAAPAAKVTRPDPATIGPPELAGPRAVIEYSSQVNDGASQVAPANTVIDMPRAFTALEDPEAEATWPRPSPIPSARQTGPPPDARGAP